ncbi:MAG: FxLYD domain-containing protein [Verrucomicrobiota bacterium]
MPRKIVLTLILLITAVISGALLFFNRKQRTPSPVQVLDYHWSKQPESSLVYVLGTLTNHSDQALLGVTIEFNLLNGNGEPIGKAQDYLAILEPRKAWRFKALVLEPTAVSAEFNLVRVLPP